MASEKNHSTELAALELVDKISFCMDNDNIPLTIFLDLSKAFDTLDKKILFAKLNHYGVRGSALQLLQSYLTDRNQYFIFHQTYLL